MRRPVALFIAVLLAAVLVSVLADASKPVPWSGDACVVEGFLITTDGYLFTPRRPDGAFDPAPYEAKKLSLQGKLLPGDAFVVEQVSVKGPCEVKSEPAIKKQLPSAYAQRAEAFLGAGDVASALRWIDKAIALEGPGCWFHERRARMLEAAGRLDEALVDAKIGNEPTCRTWKSEETLARIQAAIASRKTKKPQ